MSDLDELEETALGVAVQWAVAELETILSHHSEKNRPREIARLQASGQRMIDMGVVVKQARSLKFSDGLAKQLAALSMSPGGVRVAGLVFCAKHYPSGTVSHWRYACQRCDPDGATRGGKNDPRNVVPVEMGAL